MSYPLRIVVVGAGHLGRIHAGLLRQNSQVELVAVVDPHAAAREQAGQEFHVTSVASLDEINADFDAAVVAAPTKFHAPIGSALFARGKHVLMEKPLAISTEASDNLLQLAQASGCVLQVGHVERFNPAFQAARPKISRPQFIAARRMGRYTFRSTDVGVVLDLMIHDIDLILQVEPSELVRVQAWGTSVFGRHEDIAQARLEFRSGCVASLMASRVSPHAERSMAVYGRQIQAHIDFAERTAEIVTFPDQKQHEDASSLSAAELQYARDHLFDLILPSEQLKIAACNPLAEEHADFIRAIRQHSSPAVDGEAGRDAVSVAERVCESIRNNRDAHVFEPSLIASDPTVPSTKRRWTQPTWPVRKAG